MEFPYGIADFHKIRTGGYFYVDRTDRIALVEAAGSQLLLLRPRRFGKSLWLSTLENYYDIARASDFDRLFGALKIGRHPTPRRHQYFVLKLNFSRIQPQGDHEAIRQALFDHVNVRIEDAVARYAAWLTQPVRIDPANAEVSFDSLLSAVSRTPYKLYLLIDEYDNFANEVMVSPERGRARYTELVQGEGVLKSFFKAVKEAAEGKGLDRTFLTGVSPVVLSDITSGYNVAENLAVEPDTQDLCGFTETELQAALEQVATARGLAADQTADLLGLMRAFYNGYRFFPEQTEGVYNPTLALYFLKHLARQGTAPARLLDDNLAMDRNRLRYVANLPHGETLLMQALNDEAPLTVMELSNRFGVEEMLNAPKDAAFMASLLYYFGVLTLAGRDALGKLRLVIPNQVVRQLYVERLRDQLLPDREHQQQEQDIIDRFYTTGELGPLCELIEQRFGVLDHRDLRWRNELVVKMAFLAVLFNDASYVMDSEPALGRGYADLSLIVRPDRRQYALLDHVLEFKALKWEDAGVTAKAGRELSRADLRALP
ncbi:MAG: family ATPase, partial [Pseudomonadota bacterium]|nr:family ATPase [Pseudomonadota bacterium]